MGTITLESMLLALAGGFGWMIHRMDARIEDLESKLGARIDEMERNLGARIEGPPRHLVSAR